MMTPHLRRRLEQRFQVLAFIGALIVLLLAPKLHAQAVHDIEIDGVVLLDASALNLNSETGLIELKIDSVRGEVLFELSENNGFIKHWESLIGDTEFMLYKGIIKGNTNSWVRLTISDKGMNGAYYDGVSIQFIEQVKNIRDDLVDQDLLSNLPEQSDALVIFNASDIQHSGVCGLDHSNQAGLTGFNYQAFVDELVDLTSAAANKNIDVAIVSDTEFNAAAGGAGLNTMLSEMNIVDGIFSEQLGLQLTVDSASALTDNANMTSTNAETLLGQLGVYANTQIGNPGLAHLFTGKDLNGSTIGIAYVGAACTSFGTGVTQRIGSLTALVAAHEFGHNMGAPHDNQSGSACAGTPGSFLMNPSINGSDTFSNCSITQMQNYIQRASCIVDIVLQAPEITSDPNLVATVGESYQYDNNSRIEAAGDGDITFSLDFGPDGMTVTSDGLVSWTPSVAQAGTQSVQFSADSDTGSDTQAFDIEVEPIDTFISFNEYTLESYGQNQDGIGTLGVNQVGNQLEMNGNRWLSIPFAYTLTSNSVLEFDFSSVSEGEIHGIGLDNNNALSIERSFALYGTQNWGLRDFRYTGDGATQHFIIPIGQFFTGQMQNIFFMNDHDVSNPNANSIFANLRIYENISEQSLNLNNFVFSAYGVSQDEIGTVDVLDSGTTVKIEGNRWQKIDVDFDISENAVLEFEFKSDALGEIHGIGVDNDLIYSAMSTFQLYGSQNWGLGNFSYTGSGEYQTFSIPIGQFYTGPANVLFFVNDHDVNNPDATSYFKNIVLRQ